MFKILAVLVILGGIWFFWNKEDQRAEAPAVSSMPTRDNPSAEEMAAEKEAPEIRTMTLEMHNWYFEPEEIRVKEGTKVEIMLRSVTGTHALAIPDFGVKSRVIDAGESDAVEFVADKKGEFSFKCAVFCGEGHSGMTGKLIVE